MKKAPQFPSGRVGRRGMALVITLSVLVLMTTLVLAFFSRSTLNRQISFTGVNMVKTEQLSRNALQIIVGELRDEIASSAYSTQLTGGTPTYYQPKTTSDVVPKRMGISGADSVGITTLLKVSTSGVGIRPNGPTALAATSVSISTSSVNGRSLSTTRWFGSGGPQLGSQPTLPTWMLLTRASGVRVPAVADAKNPLSGDYVIGRFAYTVYDIGGLFNANVAGNPTTASTMAAYKPGQTYSDLSAIGFSVSQINSLQLWRNPVSGNDATTYQEWASGLARTSGSSNSAVIAAARSGHLSAAVGDNAVFSRRDLLNNSNFSSAPGLFTHFSRSLTGPSYKPTTVTTSNPNLPDVRFTVAGSITHYRDDGTTETYTVQAGDPLVQRRFSLAKLAWLGNNGPNVSAFNGSLSSSQRTKAIQDCLGLQWDSSNNRWNYVAANSSYAIKTLSELTSGTLEPNLFELLKVGIAVGSIGKASKNSTIANTEQNTREGVNDLQILRIGANMIDSADSDDYPTTIALSIGGVATPVHGVEDLPYLYGLLAGNVWSATYVDSQTNQLDWCTLFLSPVLYNPHRSGVANTGTPAAIRIRIVTGTVGKIYNPNDSSHLTRTPNSSLSSCPAVVVPQAGFANFQPVPKLIRGTQASSSTRLDSLLTSPSQVDAAHGDIHSYIYYVYTGLPEVFPIITAANPTASGASFRASMSNVLVVVEFQDASGAWRIYDTLAGNEAYQSLGTGLNNVVDWGVSTQPVTGAGGVKNITRINPDAAVNNNLSAFLGKFDARTTRFGACRSVGLSCTSSTPFIASSTAGMYWNGGFRYQMPFATGVAGSTGSNNLDVYPARWTQGGKTKWNDTDADASVSHASNIANIDDVDGIVRPADGWLGQSTYPASNLFSSTGNNSLRPVILQRPFRSVGELGYVFRDTPWKTLNFFDETSGDGGLLDLFCVNDEPAITAGRIALTGRQPLVMQSLLQGCAQEPDGTSAVSSSVASALATSFNAYEYTSGAPTTALPTNVADLATFMYSDVYTGSLKGSVNLDYIKNRREAVVRALAGSTQSRTWNLLVDVVGQSGHYSNKASSLNDFIVEGERRYWLSIAIDRYTGAVISQQLEPVNE